MFNTKSGTKKLALMQRMARLMMAATFAEANEHESALEMLTQEPGERPQQRPRKKNESRADRRPVLMA
ncbi:MAG: hypothetical protein LJE65_10720 [Desulfobacteraceae bacterium]|jgi:hypothetical protein|nr:hypothetical protein [Desulfobacteraceae bacterium]